MSERTLATQHVIDGLKDTFDAAAMPPAEGLCGMSRRGFIQKNVVSILARDMDALEQALEDDQPTEAIGHCIQSMRHKAIWRNLLTDIINQVSFRQVARHFEQVLIEEDIKTRTHI